MLKSLFMVLTLATSLGTVAATPAAAADLTTKAPVSQAEHGQRKALEMKDRPPLPSTKDELRRSYDQKPAATRATARRPATSVTSPAGQGRRW